VADLVTDDIVTRLEQMASNFKTSEWEFVYADYETVCEASQEIERLRKAIVDYVMTISDCYATTATDSDALELLKQAVRGE